MSSSPLIIWIHLSSPDTAGDAEVRFPKRNPEAEWPRPYFFAWAEYPASQQSLQSMESRLAKYYCSAFLCENGGCLALPRVQESSQFACVSLRRTQSLESAELGDSFRAWRTVFIGSASSARRSIPVLATQPNPGLALSCLFE